jgi:hypothetical protein
MNFLQNARQYETLSYKTHMCSDSICKPQNETTLKKRGLLSSTTPYVTNDRIFVCIYGTIHECTPNTCMNNNTCPISGLSDGVVIEYNSYDPNDSRTWNKEKYKRKQISLTDVYEKAKDLIETLLYSHHRTQINDKWKKQQLKLCNKEKNACINPHVPINLIQLAMIQCKYDCKTLPLEILERDEERINYYTYMVIQMYEKIQKYNSDKLCIESVTLGVLYKMKQGFKIDSVIIIPIDIYLVEHLPQMNDLPKFSIDKRKFTKGEKWITYTIEQAQKSGKNLQEIALDEKTIETVKVFKPTSRKLKSF